jgi:hypothetical protein
MNILSTGLKIASFVLAYPLEKYMTNNHEYTNQDYLAMREKLLTSVIPIANTEIKTECAVCSPQSEIQYNKAPQLQPKDLDDTIRMEQEGDYCASCVPAKHLQRSADAMKDAMSILSSKGVFTDVAEEKLQNAVYELNAAEKDLEMARVPLEMKEAVNGFHSQVRKLRNFLRQDQSGLEIATVFPVEKVPELKKSLEAAYNINNILIKYGYDLSKAQLQIRAQQRLDSEKT